GPCAGCTITLEPGGQVELSGAPLATLHETCAEASRHLAHVKAAADPLDLGLFGFGFHPTWAREDVHWMPKGRYAIMRRYMPEVGQLGIDMMIRTCTIQTNLDFSDEADMVLKLRAALALQPAATALFANSPFYEGAANGFQSYRSWIWTDTDADRCGVPPVVFEDGFGFERYVDWLIDVPMYFAYRDGRYRDLAGKSFRRFLAGDLDDLPGEKPRISDFADHATTVFPEARLKRYIEMRGADGGPWSRICALPAFWVGLMYDSASLTAAWDLVKTWTIDDHRRLRIETPKQGLRTATPDGRTLLDLCRDLLELSAAGLAARARADGLAKDETIFLRSLQDSVESGRSPADRALADLTERWDGDLSRLAAEYAY
ncbi:MAG: glutamate--cysteine ligase, partial [Pseudomonadota bacterium]